MRKGSSYNAEMEIGISGNAENAGAIVVVQESDALVFDLGNRAELVVSLNQDLFDLMRLDEFEKAIELSRRYNYFNQYGNFILNLIRQGRSVEILPLVEDLLLGPLFSEVISLNSQFSEIYYLPRLLVLAEVRQNLIEPAPASPLAIYLLSKLGSQLQFSSFLERVNKLNHSEEAQDEIEELMMEYSLLAFNKIEAKYQLREEFFSAELSGVSFDQVKTQRMFVLSEFESAEVVKEEVHPGVLATVLRNLEEYLAGESGPQYEQSQLKLDLLAVRKGVSVQEMASYVAITRLYDLMPETALRLAQAGNYNDSVNLLSILVHGSNLYTQKHDFALELLKKEIAALGLFAISKLSEEDFKDLFSVLSWTWPMQDTRRLISCRSGKGEAPECRVEQLEQFCTSILESSNRPTLIESKAPRPLLTLEEAVNL